MSAVLELPGVAENLAASVVVDQLEPEAQRRLVAQVQELWRLSPPARPHAIGGRAMHVRVASAGALAWWGDGKSYRYLPWQPGTSSRGGRGLALPPIPAEWVALWHRYTGLELVPDTALVNWYPGSDPRASLGWHADRTELHLDLPIVTLCLGRARFAVRRSERAPVSRCVLEPGAVVVLEGENRLLEHSVECLLDYDTQLELGVAPPPPRPFAPYPSPLPAHIDGRISVTLRIAGDPATASEPAATRGQLAGDPVLSWDQLAAQSADAARRFAVARSARQHSNRWWR